MKQVVDSEDTEVAPETPVLVPAPVTVQEEARVPAPMMSKAPVPTPVVGEETLVVETEETSPEPLPKPKPVVLGEAEDLDGSMDSVETNEDILDSITDSTDDGESVEIIDIPEDGKHFVELPLVHNQPLPWRTLRDQSQLREPSKYGFDKNLATSEPPTEPQTYEQAIASPLHEFWREACNEEMKLMHENRVFRKKFLKTGT